MDFRNRLNYTHPYGVQERSEEQNHGDGSGFVRCEILLACDRWRRGCAFAHSEIRLGSKLAGNIGGDLAFHQLDTVAAIRGFLGFGKKAQLGTGLVSDRHTIWICSAVYLLWFDHARVNLDYAPMGGLSWNWYF